VRLFRGALPQIGARRLNIEPNGVERGGKIKVISISLPSECASASGCKLRIDPKSLAIEKSLYAAVAVLLKCWALNHI
jgi:hypothetical protein